MLNRHDFQNMTDWLGNCHQPLLVSHQRPDGDSLGSIAAMSLMLRKMGCEPAAVLFDRFPERYGMLRESANWYPWDEVRDVLSRDVDAVVIVDTCSKNQLEPIMPFLLGGPPMLVVDHHATRDDIGTRAGDLRVFDETASANCLILAEWAREMGMEFDAPLATALFVGIATDCGWFRFSNTDARTFGMAADLVKSGVRVDEMHRAIYQQEPLAKLRLISRVLNSLELHAGGQLAVMTVRLADFAASGADRSMTEDLVNEAGRLGGCEATILFTEEPEGLIRANFRSKEKLDVSAIASRYGGGGHARAAGARLHGEWDRVVPRVVAETVEAMGV